MVREMPLWRKEKREGIVCGARLQDRRLGNGKGPETRPLSYPAPIPCSATVKLSPQPHVPVALGLWNTNAAFRPSRA